MERETDLVRDAPEHSLHRHYTFVSKLRVLISNREAAGFLAIGLAMSVLFGSALVEQFAKLRDIGQRVAV